VPYWDRALLNNYGYWKVVLMMPDGSEHEFRPTDFSPYQGLQDFLRGYYNVFPNGNPTRYYSVDGYMFARITSQSDWTVYMPDGTRVIQTPDGIQRIQDTNGNKIKIFWDANGGHYQDEQTGREIRVSYDPAANGGQGQSQVWYPTVGGVQQRIDINYGVTTVQGKVYHVSDWLPYGGEEGGGIVCQRTDLLYSQLQVVREIVFPQTEPGQQQRRFTFNYNSDITENASDLVNWSCNGGYETYNRPASRGWGELSRMTTPLGSVVDYSYSLDSNHALQFSTDDLAQQSVTQKKVTHDGTFDIWSYAISEYGAQVVSPDGANVTESKYCSTPGVGGCSTDKAGLAYRTVQPFRMVERHWINLVFSGANTASPGGDISMNPVVDYEYTTLLDANSNPLKMSAKAFQYDYNGNITQTTEYDWFDPALVSRDAQGVPTGVPGSATVLRVTNNTYYNQATGSTSGNVYAKRSIFTGVPLILDARKQTTVGPSIAQFSYDGQPYGVAPFAGNLTSWSVWDDLDTKWITNSNTYGLFGNLATSTDARGKVTQFFYDDLTHALPTSMVVDPENGTGAQTSTTSYDYHTGLVTSMTNENGNITNIDYTNQLLGVVDPLGRPGVTLGPIVNVGGINQRHRLTTTYLDSSRQMVVASDLNTENDKLLKTRTTVDMLGRRVLTEQTEDGSNYTIYSRNAYEQMGRISYTSNPMRHNVSSNTDGWTRVTNDNAGRVIEVATFGGVNQPAATGTAGIYTGSVTTSYVAETVTITDEAGKQRKSVNDAMGRLTHLYEDPSGLNYLTTYDYDVLGNLRHVYQGTQTRTFNYDSLSRLRSAIIPETGTTTYTYDDNGNLIAKTDARGVVSNYSYDALNRPVTRNYSDGTPTVTYAYDAPGIANSKGKLTSVTSSVSTYTYSGFDGMGRSNGGSQIIGSQTYMVSYTYDLAGNIKTTTYPSGRTVTSTYDSMGRTNSVTGTLGDGINRTYATGIIYDAGSRMTQEQFGTTTPIYNKLFYTSRGQLAEIREGLSPNNSNWERGAIINFYGSCWGMCAGQSMPINNGNLLRQEHWIQNESGQVIGVPTQEFDYDSLNRLRWAKEGATWKQQYSYDRYGNRLIDQGNTFGDGIPKPDFGLDTNTNRLTAPTGYTMGYDAVGNLTNDTYTGQGQRIYDAENRMKQAWANNQWQTYSYDGDGRRVKRLVNGNETWHVYGLDGKLLAEYAANTGAGLPRKEYAYRNGEAFVTATAPVGTGTGLEAQYFDNINFTNLKVTRTDATVDFDWGGGTPDSSIGIDTFTTRWIGKVEPQYSQTYTFYTVTDDGVRLWVNGQLIIDKWIDQGPTEWNGQITLTAGQRYDIRMDFYENGGGALARLSWSSNSQPKQVIPQNRLYLPGSSSQVSFNWLVSDQLGTPRIVFDQSGSLSGVSRHDYLPFGEELFAGGRGPQWGYSGADGARQKFTAKERDNETGLDFFFARYYSSSQGRFTGSDPLRTSGNVGNPQTWNRYPYTLNNPLKYIDPSGLYEFSPELGGRLTDDQLRAQAKTEEEKKKAEEIIKLRNRFRAGLAAAAKAANDPNLSARERAEIRRAVNSYGKENDRNGVQIRYESSLDAEGTWTDGKNPKGPIIVTLSLRSEGDLMTLDVAHEGSHVADWKTFNRDLARGRVNPLGGPTLYQTEHDAYRVSSFIAKSLGHTDWNYGGVPLYDKAWESLPADDREKVRAVALDKILSTGHSPGGQPLSRTNQGPTLGQSRQQAYPKKP